LAKPGKKKVLTEPAASKKGPRQAPIRAADFQAFPAAGEGPDVLDRLFGIIEARKDADPDQSHSARLLARGAPRVAQKLGEEAVECVIELVAGNRQGVIGESADLLYHLLVIWVQAGIRPAEVWRELHHREYASRLTDNGNMPLKRLLGSIQIGTRKIP
jgi:phosphoribosyl-ATP pyrophosphohydrolase